MGNTHAQPEDCLVTSKRDYRSVMENKTKYSKATLHWMRLSVHLSIAAPRASSTEQRFLNRSAHIIKCWQIFSKLHVGTTPPEIESRGL